MTTAIDQETVVCAFCKGRGTDPYGQLSSLSTCGSVTGLARSVSRHLTPIAPFVMEQEATRRSVASFAAVRVSSRLSRRDTNLSRMPRDSGRGVEWITVSPLPRPRSDSRGEPGTRRSSPEKIDMIIKTSNDLKSSLVGSAFRRATFDGCTFDLRRIKTMCERMEDRRVGRGQGDCHSAVVEVCTPDRAPVAERELESRNR